MAITEIRTHTRPSTSAVFWSDSGTPELLAAMAAIQPYIDNGKITLTRELSSDELTITQTLTYSDMETYSAVNTIFGIELNAAFMNYSIAHNLTHESSAYQQLGINQPFTVTVVYTFPEGAMLDDRLIYEYLPGIILNRNTNENLKDVTATDTSITAIFQFENSADYVQNSWADKTLAIGLHAAGVTRSYTFAFV